MVIIEVLEQKVITPYRQIDDYSTAPYIYATLLSDDQILSFNKTTGKFQIKTLSVIGHTHSEYAPVSHTQAFSTITALPTTAGGYGITDVYTKTEIDLMLGSVTVDAYTKLEVQNFFSGTTAITGYNKSNWDSAYGWGNHSGIYLSLSGGTLTGALNGTEGNFSTLSASTSITLNGRVLTIRTL